MKFSQVIFLLVVFVALVQGAPSPDPDAKADPKADPFFFGLGGLGWGGGWGGYGYEGGWGGWGFGR